MRAADIVLRARGVGVRHDGRVAVENVDLDLSTGDLVALVGPNGAGKSSLLRALAGLAPHTGSLTLHPADRHHHRHPHRPQVRVAFVAQRASPRWDLPVSVRCVVATGRLDPARWWRRTTPADDAAVDAALDRLGLSGLAGRPVAALSGGQAQRVLLARALAQDPDVLLLDEPCEGLDEATTETLFCILTELAAAGVAVCCALHELEVVRRRFHRAVAVDRVLLADGPVADVLPVVAPGAVPPARARYGVGVPS